MERMITRFKVMGLCVVGTGLLVFSGWMSNSPVLAEEDGVKAPEFQHMGRVYRDEIQPLVKQFCLDCHNSIDEDGDLDLERFKTLESVRQDPRVFQKMLGQLRDNEMPPEDEPQLSEAQKKSLIKWIESYLDAEALANAGDPGPVLLRRLNHTEYTYTIQDLTGVPLDPAHDFPVDGAAGEGFTNTGSSLTMSPALFSRYLDASREIAQHAVLLPDGFRFSEGKRRREWTDEILFYVRGIYDRHTSGKSDMSGLNRWNVSDPKKATDNNGQVALERYFHALIVHRDMFAVDAVKTAERVAPKLGLNAKYLGILGQMLHGGDEGAVLLSELRKQYQAAKPEQAGAIAKWVQGWQDRLWRFNSVGHFGSIRSWQVGVNPLVDRVALRQKLEGDAKTFTLNVTASTAGDDGEEDVFVLQNPRVVFEGGHVLKLKDLGYFTHVAEEVIEDELRKTQDYLMGAAAVHREKLSIKQVAQKHALNEAVLRAWVVYLDLANISNLTLTGHFPNRIRNVHGNPNLHGWGDKSGASVIVNKGKETANFLTITAPPKSVILHPWPTVQAVVAWQSPIDGRISIQGAVADADNKCGNGAAYSIELWRMGGMQRLVQGVIDNGGRSGLEVKQPVEVSKGDIVTVVIDARDGNHVCDTTHVQLMIQEAGGAGRKWDVTPQAIKRIESSNILPDAHGNERVWHFLSRSADSKQKEVVVPAESRLGAFRQALVNNGDAAEMKRLAEQVKLIVTGKGGKPNEIDKKIVSELRQFNGPLKWMSVLNVEKLKGSVDNRALKQASAALGVELNAFGKSRYGVTVDADSIVYQAPAKLSLNLPVEAVAGGTFVADAIIPPGAGKNASVQVALTDEQASGDVLAGVPVLTLANSPARKRVVDGLDAFRSYFPKSMCYAQIVPVDEVVTLVLFHREDEHLSRLMLSEAESKKLDRLWAELRYVSWDALVSVDALDQILEFATQDGDPRTLDPVNQPIRNQAMQFRKQLLKSEPLQLDALIAFAAKAYRRPLSSIEQQTLRDFYASFRAEGIEHDEAFRLTLSRVLASPSFLYKMESAGPGKKPVPVNQYELATRLSYFLWSSMPDEQLTQLAEKQKLSDPDVLYKQARRMMADQRMRRFAVEFGAQWLHVRDFDKHDEKSERHFPQFNALRDEMYEEVIQYWVDMVRNDGSVMALIDSDHTFLNETLAKHYGIDGVTGTGWWKVNGMKKYGRGGLLGMGAILSKQSGASRSSPILRGNWIYETILGQHLPNPPPNVPDLPTDENKSTLTMRQLVEKHSSVAECFKCHQRIDHYGFAMESFDAIGGFREKDSAGRDINTIVDFPGQGKVDGINGLKQYLVTVKKDVFVTQFCRKLVGYALGRSVVLSDQPLIEKMKEALEQNDYRFSVALKVLLESQQFTHIRGREFTSVTD